MSDVKQVKVDNWGIYFLQRLKHFFNRTDYCDLTLQFQDNAQLKVHRLVLNACTEYFELLERTCEMYEDCLVMPEDLQADVVVPIVNFMYTGQLEFRMEALERLYQTSQIMNMPVLSKLLEAHRDGRNLTKNSSQHFGSSRRYSKAMESSKVSKFSTPTPSTSSKRTYTKAFESNKTPNTKISEQRRSTPNKPANKSNELIIYRDKKLYLPQNKQSSNAGDTSYRAPSPIPLDTSLYNKRLVLGEPRPTRYELPEDLDTENVFDNSFSNISYASQPLMVHPETTKQYSAKKNSNSFNATSSKKSFINTVDIVECKKVIKNDNIFDDDILQSAQDDDIIYQSAFLSKDSSPKDSGQLFDQILDNNDSPKVTIESKDKQAGNLDHAKIISEVLKKYPHLVKSNKNIKLKILNTPAKGKKTRPQTVNLEENEDKHKEVKSEVPFTYETDVLDSKEAAKLISMGAENVKGPWICLICGTPGKALNFTSYYNFRRHLVEVHKEKPVSTICEYCGLKSFKRNYLLHHIYTKHAVPPPPPYHFPKCPMCDYIALTESFLVKHKLTHSEPKVGTRCSVCQQSFNTGNQLLLHIQKSGHKQSVYVSAIDKKPSIQCSYCMKVFLRDNNFYCHLKTSHKDQALKDGLIEDSDDEKQSEEKPNIVKHEHTVFENELEAEDIQYQIQKQNEGSMHNAKKAMLFGKKVHMQQKILNTGFNPSAVRQPQKPKMVSDVNTEFIQEIHNPAHGSEGNIVVINDVEYIMNDNQLIPRKAAKQDTNEEYILSDMVHQDEENDQRLQNLEAVTPTTSMDITNVHSTETIQQPKMILKKSATINQPIQIVVSNEEEYKALMASNHSIIFDDGDTNKTLTVLTAPQNSTLDNTGIDLENTQSNDMMIIQEDYPLHVSEAVSDDNKYVVVYSHAIDHNDPTKQFQIITPQDISAQYVQSSAVITQNYDTVTTTSSVVNTNVLGSQIEESWPQNDQNISNQGTILVAPEIRHESITPADQTTLKTDEIENPLVGLPEVEILRIQAKTSLVQLDQIQNEVNQSNEHTLETISSLNPEQMVEESQPNNIEEAINIEITADQETEKENTIVEEAQITADHIIEAECPGEISMESMPIEICSQEQEMTEETESHLEQPVVPTPPQEAEVPHSIEEQTEMSLPMEGNESMIEVTQSEINENVTTANIDADGTNEEETCDSQENTVIEEVSVQTESVQPPVLETKEQIQNLTSEWSEDEYDTILEEPETTKSNHSNNKNVISEEPELEESIENIQQEVQKQIGEVDNLDVCAEVQNEAPPQEVNEPTIDDSNPGQTNAVVTNSDETQEKISSLLNDWDDNDSQSTSINENGDENPTIVDSNKNEPDADAITHKVTHVETKKDDNIKSLVSDWDEEDEEDNNTES